jgi:hypothetical protein
MQAGSRVTAVAIPAQQRADGERVTKAVQRGRPDSVRRGQAERAGQLVEDRAGRARVDAVAPVEGEQRRLVAGRSLFTAAGCLAGDEFGDARPVRDKPALAELAAMHDQQGPLLVKVTQAQPARFPGPQAQSVAEGEDRPVGAATAACPGVVGQSRRGLQQQPGQRDVEQERDPRRGDPARPGLQRRDLQQPLGDRPVQQSADHAEQVVEAAGP